MSQTKVQLIKDGALAEDSIVHDGDTNTKIRFSGTDTITAETGGSERLRIDASGNINIANDSGKLQLGTGNDLQIYHDGSNSKLQNSFGRLHIENSGGVIRTNTNHGFFVQSADGNTTYAEIDNEGLKFNGDTAGDNALDDYEEGTFSPSFKASGASGNSNTTVNEVKYIKIGGMVHFSFYIDMNAHHSDGTGGHVEITGLPFQNTGNHVAISVGYFNSFIQNQNFVSGTVQPGTSELILRHTTTETTGTANMDYSNAIGTSTEIIISGCYATAS